MDLWDSCPESAVEPFVDEFDHSPVTERMFLLTSQLSSDTRPV